jgi:hypothetical protein
MRERFTAEVTLTMKGSLAVLLTAVLALGVLATVPGLARSGVVTTSGAARQSAAPARLELVGRIDGHYIDVVASDGYAYAVERLPNWDSRLRVLDLTDLAHPRTVGSLDVYGPIRAVAVANHWAYLVGDSDSPVIDVRDPTRPVRVDGPSYLPAGNSIAVADGYAYVAGGSLTVLDLTKPDRPEWIGDYVGWAGGDEVAVAGTYAYLARDELAVVDVRQPDRPRGVWQYTGNRGANDLAVAGRTAYVADAGAYGERGLLRVFDLTSLATASQVGTLEFAADPWAIAVAGRYAVVVDADAQMHLVAVGAAAAPTGLQTLPWPAPVQPPQSWSNRRASVAIAGDQVYVTYPGAGLLTLRLTGAGLPTPPAPRPTVAPPAHIQERLYLPYVSRRATPIERTGTWTLVGRLEEHDRIWFGVAVDGRYVYLGEGVWHNEGPTVTASASLAVVDVSAPAAPHLVGRTASFPGLPLAVAIAGRTAYVGGPYGKLQAVDVTDPSQPRLLGSIKLPHRASDVAVAGHYAYIAASDAFGTAESAVASRMIARPAGPRSPHRQLTGQPASPATDGFGLGHMAEAAYPPPSTPSTPEGALCVVDVATPGAPRLVATLPVRESPVGIALAGKFAYVANLHGDGDPSGSMEIFDVSAPAAPRWIASYSIPNAWDIAVAGTRAYVVNAASFGKDTVLPGGLWSLDVSDPARPREVGSLVTVDDAWDALVRLAAAGSDVYTAGHPSGESSALRAIDVRDPTWPREVARMPSPAGFWDMAAADGYVYLITTDGMVTYQLLP